MEGRYSIDVCSVGGSNEEEIERDGGFLSAAGFVVLYCWAGGGGGVPIWVASS